MNQSLNKARKAFCASQIRPTPPAAAERAGPTASNPSFTHANWDTKPEPSKEPVAASMLETPPPAAHIEGGGVVEFRDRKSKRGKGIR